MVILQTGVPTDEDFIAAVRTVYEERLDDFSSVAAAITGNRSGARDVVHDAFASALRSRRQYRGDGELGGWIWRIVVNTARDQRRKRAPLLAELPDETPELQGPREHDPSESRLAEAIQELPERQRVIIFLRYYADLEYRQIGEVLGIATGTVSAALNAAHRTLERQLNGVEQ